MSQQKVAFGQMRGLIQGQRLIQWAGNAANARFVREACERAGVKSGDRVVDVGCGPLGALPVLATLVGPEGQAVGIDHNRQMLEIAQQRLRDLGLSTVSLIHADVNLLPPDALTTLGPFDAAYCRLFLVNQIDPAATLRQIAALVRPGGHVIAHEFLDDPTYPSFIPQVPAVERFVQLMHASMRQSGRKPEAARDFRTLVRCAGLEEIAQRGVLNADPSDAPDFIQEQGLGLLLVFKEALLKQGLASREEIAELIRELKIASARQYQAFFGWIMIELIARVPATET
jgi:ubiquinone/menaquinone biosynthesis C-methylase UbiE